MKPRLPLLMVILLLGRVGGFACEICGAQQPEILRGLTHGAGPQGNFDYVIVAVTIGIVLFALGYAIKFVVRPGEREADHIKRIVLTGERHGS